ncbi:MAG TPA: FAD-binding oxidoreductase, partial [Patescibacteria group bacterium]|nr:FAD-binding oxidoreductase [Patescibacteria group bacterium]
VTGFMHRGGRVLGVETTAGRFESDWVVNAAGAWAGPLASLAGLEDPGLVSYRRHLFGSAALEGIDPSWPWVWDLPHDVYFRVDGDRLLLCACDVEPHPPAAPEVSQAVAEDLASRLAAALPMAAMVKVESARACLRTFAPDRRYVIGPDPRLEGFFWVAGLGGTGATSGAAVGELAAGLLLDASQAPPWARDFDPARLIPDAES